MDWFKPSNNISDEELIRHLEEFETKHFYKQKCKSVPSIKDIDQLSSFFKKSCSHDDLKNVEQNRKLSQTYLTLSQALSFIDKTSSSSTCSSVDSSFILENIDSKLIDSYAYTEESFTKRGKRKLSSSSSSRDGSKSPPLKRKIKKENVSLFN